MFSYANQTLGVATSVTTFFLGQLHMVCVVTILPTLLVIVLQFLDLDSDLELDLDSA